jgi:hypothetical protein
LSRIDDLDETTLNILFWVPLEVKKVEVEGGRERGDDEEDETKPVFEAEYASYCAGEAGRDELDIVYRVVVEQDVRTE